MTVHTPQRGANPARVRSHNRQLVLAHLLAHGPLGRAEIARLSGLTTQTVSNIIADLEADGMLHTAGAVQGRRGLPAMRYRMKATGGFALGFELRPGAALATLVDMSGTLLWADRVLLSEATPDAVAALLPRLRDAAMTAVPGAAARLLGAGIVMPGPFGRSGLSGQAIDLPGWKTVDRAAFLSTALDDLPTVVENDANAAAMAERIALAPEGINSFACLYFGTGLGLGIVHGDRLVSGAHGNAGEIGQLPLPGSDRRLEDVLSRAALSRRFGATDIDALAALHANCELNGWIADAAPALAHALAVIENLFDPATTVLCGAIPHAILADLVAATRLPRTVAPETGPRRLRIGTCHRSAAARGAAALILSRSFTPALAS